MEEIKVIKTNKDYEDALSEIEKLIDLDPEEGTSDANKLDVLTLLVQEYEKNNFPIDLPDPVDAIKYRMNEMRLTNKDLVDIIGSKSKVSEVLNKKVPLSLRMIRALHKELGIPAEVLLNESKASLPEPIDGIDWTKFPIAELLKKKWISFTGTVNQAKEQAEELIRRFFESAGCSLELNYTQFRQTMRSNGNYNSYSLKCWIVRVNIIAQSIELSTQFNKDKLNDAFFDNLVKLSSFQEGPRLAMEFLYNHGIKMIHVDHLKATHLDGACLKDHEGNPIIALTFRYDRLDNFWFVLFHELGHLKLHQDDDNTFLDDLDADSKERIEHDADTFASEHLIQKDYWNRIVQEIEFMYKDNIISYARDLSISPSIIAGRIRKERGNYRIFKELVGYNEVRKHFGDC